MNDTPARHCPACSEESLIRLISAAGFQLKGTGWYVTDFKNKEQPKQDTSKSTENTTSADTTPTVSAATEGAKAETPATSTVSGASEKKQQDPAK